MFSGRICLLHATLYYNNIILYYTYGLHRQNNIKNNIKTVQNVLITSFSLTTRRRNQTVIA